MGTSFVFFLQNCLEHIFFALVVKNGTTDMYVLVQQNIGSPLWKCISVDELVERSTCTCNPPLPQNLSGIFEPSRLSKEKTKCIGLCIIGWIRGLSLNILRCVIFLWMLYYYHIMWCCLHVSLSVVVRVVALFSHISGIKQRTFVILTLMAVNYVFVTLKSD